MIIILQNQLNPFIYKYLFERNTNFNQRKNTNMEEKNYNCNNKFITATKRQSHVQ